MQTSTQQGAFQTQKNTTKPDTSVTPINLLHSVKKKNVIHFFLLTQRVLIGNHMMLKYK